MAFFRARLCQGASSDAPDLPLARSRVVLAMAAIFSRTIRRYSAGEQVPAAIIAVRRAITSIALKPSSAIIIGSAVLRRRISGPLYSLWHTLRIMEAMVAQRA